MPAGEHQDGESGQIATPFIVEWEASDEWSSLASHPWIVSLIHGELSPERFRFWHAHNLYYVAEPISLMALPRMPRHHGLRSLIVRYAAQEDDSSLRDGLVDELGADSQEWWWAGPAREAFTNFLRWISYEGTFPEICCANYPCFAFAKLVAAPYFSGEQARLPAEQRTWLEQLSEPLAVDLFNELHASIASFADDAIPAVRQQLWRVLVRATQHQVRTLDAAWYLDDPWRPASWITS